MASLNHGCTQVVGGVVSNHIQSSSFLSVLSQFLFCWLVVMWDFLAVCLLRGLFSCLLYYAFSNLRKRRPCSRNAIHILPKKNDNGISGAAFAPKRIVAINVCFLTLKKLFFRCLMCAFNLPKRSVSEAKSK